MQSIDIFLHVRPFLEDGAYRGLAMFFNPTSEVIKDTYDLPLYYTGLEDQALVTLEGVKSTSKMFKLSRDYNINVAICKNCFEITI
jgi:hypothetical protein